MAREARASAEPSAQGLSLQHRAGGSARDRHHRCGTFAGGYMRAAHRAIWVEDRQLDDEAVLASLLAANGLPPSLLDLAKSDAIRAQYDANRDWAIEVGIFGAPSYVLDGEIFWGQDRLEMLAEMLESGRARPIEQTQAPSAVPANVSALPAARRAFPCCRACRKTGPSRPSGRSRRCGPSCSPRACRPCGRSPGKPRHVGELRFILRHQPDDTRVKRARVLLEQRRRIPRGIDGDEIDPEFLRSRPSALRSLVISSIEVGQTSGQCVKPKNRA